MLSSLLLCSLHRSKDAPRGGLLSPTAASLSAISSHPLPFSLLYRLFAGLLGLVSLGNLSVEALVPEHGGWPIHLDLSVSRPFGAHRDNSPVTRGRAAVSTQLGEAQVSSDLGCVEFETKPNILLTTKLGTSQVK